MVIGYACGVFDMLHIGHLNLLRNAKENCDYLIVGVSTDELCEAVKRKKPVIPFKDRFEIVESIRFVDKAVPQINMDKLSACRKYNATVVFAGDDHKNTELWDNYEREFDENGIKVIYFPYTKGISSTKLAGRIL